MDLNKFRLGLAHIFVENKKISGKMKKHLINFIETADIHQLKSLAMDGEVVSKKDLDADLREILDARFGEDLEKKINKAALEGINFVLQELIGSSLAIGAAAGGTTYLVIRKKASNACKRLWPNDPEKRKVCIKDYMNKLKSSASYKADKKQQKDTKKKQQDAYNTALNNRK